VRVSWHSGGGCNLGTRNGCVSNIVIGYDTQSVKVGLICNDGSVSATAQDGAPYFRARRTCQPAMEHATRSVDADGTDKQGYTLNEVRAILGPTGV